jgi:hypothetical protein
MAQAPSQSPRKPRVLLAAREQACEPFRRALGDDAEVVEAHTMDSAVAQLQGSSPPEVVCCTVYFDESRMFDLLRWVRSQCAHIPVVCARALPKDIAKVSIEAVRIAVHALGGATFVDLPALEAEHGNAEATARLRLIILGMAERR